MTLVLRAVYCDVGHLAFDEIEGLISAYVFRKVKHELNGKLWGRLDLVRSLTREQVEDEIMGEFVGDFRMGGWGKFLNFRGMG